MIYGYIFPAIPPLYILIIRRDYSSLSLSNYKVKHTDSSEKIYHLAPEAFMMMREKHVSRKSDKTRGGGEQTKARNARVNKRKPRRVPFLSLFLFNGSRGGRGQALMYPTYK